MNFEKLVPHSWCASWQTAGMEMPLRFWLKIFFFLPCILMKSLNVY